MPDDESHGMVLFRALHRACSGAPGVIVDWKHMVLLVPFDGSHTDYLGMEVGENVAHITFKIYEDDAGAPAEPANHPALRQGRS